jgi:hypothetical protein
MRTSNLAECLAEFEATIVAVDVAKEKPARATAAEECGTPPRAPRRLSLESRRIQIRDTGLPQFRVF